jgi:outer membrane protein assembly factor BamB
MLKVFSMTRPRVLTVAVAFLLGPALVIAQAKSAPSATHSDFVSTGVRSIDAMRKDFASRPTTPANAARRHSQIFSWVRLLVHRGIDMRDFHEACAPLSEWGPIGPSRYGVMENAWRTLEMIQTNPKFIGEIQGTKTTGRVDRTDWPVFQGNREQSGLSPDTGPTSGEIDWKFPIGLSWYAAPAVEGGRVFVASPGVTTLMYCINEKSGETIWVTPQNGLQIYSTPRASSACVIQKDEVVVRATSGSWEFSEKAEHIFYIDKKNGRVTKQVPGDRVDYRRGYAPVHGNETYLVYPYGRLDLRGRPAFALMQDTVIVRKANGTPWWTLRVGDMFGEPILGRKHVFAPTDSGIFYALHLTGPQRVAWIFNAQAPLRCTPAIDETNVYFGAQDGTVYALNIADGRVRWKRKVNEGEPRAHQLFSRPTILGSKLFIGSATKELYCIDTETGELIWKAATSDWIRSRPLALGDLVYAATLDGKVTAFDGNGMQRWSESAGRHSIFADLVGNENGILVSSSGLYLYSLNPSTGKQQWRHSLLQCIYEGDRRILADVVAAGGDYQSPPTVSNGKVFVGGPDRFVHVIDHNTGKEIWRFETSGQVSAAVTIQNGKVFFGQQGGNSDVYCVREDDGTPIWTSKVGWVWTTSTPDGDRLFNGTVQGDICALSTDDGRVLWKRPTNGGIYPAPAVSNGRVYTGSWDGYYYALDKRTGLIDWCYATEGVDYSFGGGPDSAAAIIWKGKLVCRVVPQTLIALDQDSGKEIWRFRDITRADGRHTMNATPSASGNRIFASTSIDHDGMPCGGRLFCVDDSTGKLVWEYTGAGGWTGSSCTKNSVLCGSSTDVFMSCLDVEGNPDGTARVIWRTRVGSIFQESIPAIYGDQGFILCSDGYLYAFD